MSSGRRSNRRRSSRHRTFHGHRRWHDSRYPCGAAPAQGDLFSAISSSTIGNMSVGRPARSANARRRGFELLVRAEFVGWLCGRHLAHRSNVRAITSRCDHVTRGRQCQSGWRYVMGEHRGCLYGLPGLSGFSPTSLGIHTTPSITLSCPAGTRRDEKWQQTTGRLSLKLNTPWSEFIRRRASARCWSGLLAAIVGLNAADSRHLMSILQDHITGRKTRCAGAGGPAMSLSGTIALRSIVPLLIMDHSCVS